MRSSACLPKLLEFCDLFWRCVCGVVRLTAGVAVHGDLFWRCVCGAVAVHGDLFWRCVCGVVAVHGDLFWRCVCGVVRLTASVAVHIPSACNSLRTAVRI